MSRPTTGKMHCTPTSGCRVAIEHTVQEPIRRQNGGRYAYILLKGEARAEWAPNSIVPQIGRLRRRQSVVNEARKQVPTLAQCSRNTIRHGTLTYPCQPAAVRA